MDGLVTQMPPRFYRTLRTPLTLLYQAICHACVVQMTLTKSMVGVLATGFINLHAQPYTQMDEHRADVARQNVPLVLSPEEIEAKLDGVKVADTTHLTGITLPANPTPTSDTSTQPSVSSHIAPISRIGTSDVPLGLDITRNQKLPTLQSVTSEHDARALSDGQVVVNENNELDPSAYIPQYEYQETAKIDEREPSVIDEPKKLGLVKGLYNRLFNDGQEISAKVEVHLYDDTAHATGAKSTDISQLNKYSRKVLKNEPFANIIATLEDMNAASIADFRGSIPRLRQAVVTASRAVGYYDMEFTITKAAAGEVNIIVHRLGDPVRADNQVLDIRGQGADNPTFMQVVNEPSIHQGDVFNHGKYEATKAAITDSSAEHGYFDARWLNSSVDVILPDNIADVSLVYDTGDQYAFDNVVFFTMDPQTKTLTTDPAKLPVKPELLRKLMTHQMGDAYNRTAARNLSNNLLATGYFNAVNTEAVLPSPVAESGVNFSVEQADRAKKEVSEQVNLGDGVIAEIAPIEFSASQAIHDKLALVRQKAEQLYNAPDDRLLITDSREQSKTIFGRISDAVSNIARAVLPDETGDELPQLSEDYEPPTLQGRKTPQDVYQDKKVPLYVFVMSDKPKDAQLGIGYGSDSGVRLTGKFNHNLINKHGVQAGVDVKFSQNDKGVNAYITRPMTHPLNDKLKGLLSYEEERINKGVGTFDLYTRTLQTGISRNIVKEGGWNRSYSLRYRLDELETNAPSDIRQDLPIEFIDNKPTQEAILAGYAMHKTIWDNPLAPMRGYRQYYSLEAGAKGVMTDTNMAILQAGVSGIYSFGDNLYGRDRAHQLIGSLNAGYIWADDFSAVPYKLRFFAGGDQSIRGYNYQSLSPLSDKGYLTGGQAIAVASGEYNYEVREGLRLALFSDVGNAYDKNFSNDTKIGAGVGLRYASPVGQVRVDIATGVGEEGNPIKLHFFIGTPF